VSLRELIEVVESFVGGHRPKHSGLGHW
jgi:hypothetical protein